MITRTHSKNVLFNRAFMLKGVDRTLPPGNYRVVTDEELIEGLSFAAYRRVSTAIFVPAEFCASSIEMVLIDPVDLQAAMDRDELCTVIPEDEQGEGLLSSDHENSSKKAYGHD